MLDELDKHSAWRLARYTQPWEDGEVLVLERIYVCQVLVNDEWMPEAFGGTPELAAARALGLEPP